MFSAKEKQLIAKTIEELLLSLDHPEMPKEKPIFSLHVEGKEQWSWANITPNWTNPAENPNGWNEIARDVLAEHS